MLQLYMCYLINIFFEEVKMRYITTAKGSSLTQGMLEKNTKFTTKIYKYK